MAQTKVTITVTPEEHRTMVEHLTEARSLQQRRSAPGGMINGEPVTPAQRRQAEQEYRKLNSLINAL